MMRLIIFLFLLFLPHIVAAQEVADTKNCSNKIYGPEICISEKQFKHDLCFALEAFATRYTLDPYFFTRLVWQESRFDPNAHSHANAMGIAQFIASTAKLQGLDDPFNPAEALDASARYLADLIGKFDNLGLAASAYNAGETAARNFKNEAAGLPNETWKYVQIITGYTPRQWRDMPPQSPDFTLTKGQDFQTSCNQLADNQELLSKQIFTSQFKKWGVQIASGNTRDAAAADYKRSIRTCKRMLKSLTPDFIYLSPEVKLRRPFYAARISFESGRNAHAFCTRLKQYKCKCAVYKN